MKRASVFSYECSQTLEGGSTGETQSFVKDVIACGQLVCEKRGWRLKVTSDRMRKWADNFALMRERGVEVPFVKDHIVDSDHTLGYVTGMALSGDRLMATQEIRGKDNINLVKTVNRVSVFIEPNFVDGKGNKYDEAITHISLTPIPVHPGQDGFISIAASRGQAIEVPVFSLAASKGDQGMNKELLAKFRARVKAAAEAAEEDVLNKLSEHLDAIDAERAQKEKELKAKSDEATSLKAKVQELETGKPKELDADLAEERAADVTARVDKLVESGKVPERLAASLKQTLVGVDGARNGFMLSRDTVANDKGVKPVRANVILDILESIEPVKLGSQTPGQGVALSREAKDGLDAEVSRIAKLGSSNGSSTVVL